MLTQCLPERAVGLGFIHKPLRLLEVLYRKWTFVRTLARLVWGPRKPWCLPALQPPFGEKEKGKKSPPRLK